MMKENGTLIALFVLVFIILGAFWWLNRQGYESTSVSLTTISPTPASQINETAIRDALVKNYNKPQDSLNLVPLEVRGDYARGSVIFKNDDRVWLWLAFENDDGDWQLVHDGQGIVSCQHLEEVSFPADLARECFSKEENRLINR